MINVGDQVCIRSVNLSVVNKIESTIWVNCEVCSKDTELFPSPIKTSERSLFMEKLPCRCSKSYRLNKEQYLILINRKLHERNYELISLPEGNLKSHTKITLLCKEDGNKWDTPITALLSDVGCMVCSVRRIANINRISDEDNCKRFLATGKFLEGTSFVKNTIKTNHRWEYNYYDMFCPRCSTDEFVENGLCSGVFTGSISSFKNGKIPCRCSKSYRWGQGQREYQLTKLLSADGHKFIGFDDNGYTGCECKPIWVCKNGHYCDTSSISNLLKCARCKHCASYGSPRRPSQEYLDDAISSGTLRQGTKIIDEFDRGYVRFISYHCPVCSIDEYVSEGLCSGKFDISLPSLLRGSKACRCSKGYKYTKDQMRLRVTKILNTMNATLVSIDFTGEFERRKVTAESGGVEKVLNLNAMLGGAYSEAFFLEDTFRNIYISIWELDKMLAIKVGITKLDPSTRIWKQGSQTMFTLKETFVFRMVERCLAEQIEKDLKSMYGGSYLSKADFPDGYTETYSPQLLEEILKFIKNTTSVQFIVE